MAFPASAVPLLRQSGPEGHSLFIGGDGLYHYASDKYKKYLKTVDLRKAGEEVIISLERLCTLSINAQAREYGYGGVV